MPPFASNPFAHFLHVAENTVSIAQSGVFGGGVA